MGILKVIEKCCLIPNKNWEVATKKAVQHASKTLKNIRSVYVQDQSATVSGGEVDEFRVNLKITFEVN